MTKQITIFFISLVIIISSITYAYREARAALPLAVIAASVVTNTGARYALNSAALLTGAAIANYIEIKDEANPSQSVAIPLSDRTDRMPPAPNAPATTTPTTEYTYTIPWVGSANSAAGVCSMQLAVYAQQNCASNPAGGYFQPACNMQSATDSSCNYSCSCGGGPEAFGSVGISKSAANPSCPAGYGYASNQCSLSDARAASPDGRIDYSRAPGSTSITPASSNDADKNNTSVPVRSNADGSVTATGRGSDGNMEAITIKPLVGGGVAVTKYQNNGNGTVTAHVSGYDGTGAPLNYTRTYTPGNLSYNQTTGATTIQASPSTVATPDGGSTVNAMPQTVVIGGTGAAAPSTPIQFPSDYARQGEAVSAANPLGTKLDTLHDDLTKPVIAPTDPAIPETTQFTDTFFKDTFVNLKAWNLPSHNGSCPTWQFNLADYHLGNHTFDAHCTIGEQIRSQLSSIMIVVWTLIAMFIVLGA